jgi:surface antigen
MLRIGRTTTVYALFITLSASIAPAAVSAKSIHFNKAHYYHDTRPGHHRYRHGGVIQCVAFAKQDAGIVISGNARDWWSNAAGVYQRGRRPEAGSVLSFMANGRMPLGHVAVVSAVEDSRTITIDQAHWAGGGISRDIVVKDVSEDNDWSAVRVQLAHEGAFGSIYPTHGFIYPRPDSGVLVEASEHAPMPVLDQAPADLRRSVRHYRSDDMEVAEAPRARRGLDLSLNGLGNDAPDRALQ